MGDTYIRTGGNAKKVQDAYRKVGGVWVPARELYTRITGISKQVFAAEIVVSISATITSTVLSNLFSSGDWASEKRKRVIITSTGVVNSNMSWGAIAAQNGGQPAATWGGELILENRGAILGMGGVPNSGEGGRAIYDDAGQAWAKKLIVNNYGAIRAGGGAGGNGGTGGGGYYEYTVREPSSGESYVPAAPQTGRFDNVNTNVARIMWQGAEVHIQGGIPGDPINTGGWAYYRGTLFYTDGSGGNRFYAIWRQRQQGVNTGGGAGGNGGRGQGSDGNNTLGSGGAGGDTNAGSGGTGGAGGTWGADGAPGSIGNAGNAGGGYGGNGGGQAGIAYSSAIVQMNNYNVINGRVI